MTYLVPVAIVNGVRDAAGDVSMTQIITKAHLSIFDLQDDGEIHDREMRGREADLNGPEMMQYSW